VTVRDSPLAQKASAEGFQVYGVSPTSARPSAALKISEVVEKIKAVIVHTHEAHALTAAWLARAHRRMGLVVSRRLAYPLGKSSISLNRYRRVARILAVSRFVAESVVNSGIDPGKVTVVYDGVEIPPPVSSEDRAKARKLLGIPAEQIVLGCVGYLLPEKGQELLVRAWPAVLRQSKNCRLWLAGDGPMRPRLESLSQELGVAESVRLAGFVEDVSAVYRALDVFLFPSLAEPLGSSMLAAMAHGLPTVAVARGAVPEVIKDGENGLLAQEPEPDQFAAPIVRMLQNPDFAKDLGAAARQTIQSGFSAEKMVRGTLEAYNQIIAQGPR
ncbi:MAG: glycosyltransferase family 4 protein, partial [Deltaproteobacteria bacterium]